VKSTLRRCAGETPSGFPPPYKLTGITNPTASKVIKKILDIQEKIELIIEQVS
jgi:hypothetical protein